MTPFYSYFVLLLLCHTLEFCLTFYLFFLYNLSLSFCRFLSHFLCLTRPSSLLSYSYSYYRWMHRPLIITPAPQGQAVVVAAQMEEEAQAALMMVMAVPGTDPRSLVGQVAWATTTPGQRGVRMMSVKEEQTMKRMKRSTCLLRSQKTNCSPTSLLRHPHFHS